MRAILAAIAVALAGPVFAQQYAESDGANLRFLDKLTSETGDVALRLGQSAEFGRLVVRLDGCRYPADNPTSDASALLSILDGTSESEVFKGWMLASSPALSALDHPRYDVWVLGCLLPDATAEATSDIEGE